MDVPVRDSPDPYSCGHPSDAHLLRLPNTGSITVRAHPIAHTKGYCREAGNAVMVRLVMPSESIMDKI